MLPPSACTKARRAERHRQGLTLEDLAERSGLTWSYISQVERGLRNIIIDNQDALARGLSVALRDLLPQDTTGAVTADIS